MLIDQVFFNGLEQRQVDGLELIYFGNAKANSEVNGYHTDDILESLEYSNKRQNL